jgi:segregation and condensation protein A
MELGAILHEKFKQKDVITLDELLDPNTDKIITYISLLFMATRKEIWLEQPELFGELYITRGEPDV